MTACRFAGIIATFSLVVVQSLTNKLVLLLGPLITLAKDVFCK